MKRTARAIGVAVALLSGAWACAVGCGGKSDSLGSGGSGSGSSGGGSSGGSSSGSFSNVPKNWACLQQPVPAPVAGSAQAEFFFKSMSDNATIPGVQVQACEAIDFTCASPLSQATGDDTGVALLTVPAGFSGYYEAQASAFVPTILSRPPPASNEYVPQLLANAAILNAVPMVTGVTQDPTLGIAFLSALDCASSPAGGVVFSIGSAGPNERLVYLLSNIPSEGATQTDSSSGTALIFNVPPGLLTVTASLAATGVAIRTASASVRENWLTYVTIRPDQAAPLPIP
jgi:hypothetical protein